MADPLRRFIVTALSLFALTSVAEAQAKLLVMRAKCADQTNYPPPFTVGNISEAFDLLGEYAENSSYGAYTVDDWDLVNVQLPCDWSDYTSPNSKAPNNRRSMRDALAFARYQLGINLETYTHHVLLTNLRDAPNKFEAGKGGNGVPGGKVWLSGISSWLVAHEVFHSENIAHPPGRTDVATAENPGPHAWLLNRSLLEKAFYQQYGNPFDFMGSGAVFRQDAQLNVRTKHYRGWLPDSRITNVTDPAVTEYDLYQQDTLTLPASVLPTALRIPRDSRSDYWVEFRQQLSGEPPGCEVNADQGILVYIGDRGWRYMGRGVDLSPPFDPAQLLDMHWGTTCGDQWLDAALEQGETFLEPAIGVGVELLSIEPAAGGDPPHARVKVTLPAPATSSANAYSQITFTHPPNTVTEYFNPGTRTFRAEIADAEGIAGVRFELYAGGETPYATVVGVDEGPGASGQKYSASFDLSSLNVGGHVLQAVVTDGAGRDVAGGTYFLVAFPFTNCASF